MLFAFSVPFILSVKSSMSSIISKIPVLICDFFFPHRCPVCDEVLPVSFEESPYLICPECTSKLFPVHDPICMKCGKPLGSLLEYCDDCVRHTHYFKQGKTIFLYKGAMHETMYRFKYSTRREYADFFAAQAVKAHRMWLLSKQFDIIIPVPMYARKKRKRGYNQAEDFAYALGKLLDIPVKCDVIVRIRDTAPMKGLSREDRAKNMKNAFQLVKNGVKYNRVLVVDDIYTTGSTIDAIAKTLSVITKDGVYFMSICTGQG